MEIVRERSYMLAGHAEDSRVLGDNRVICEAISVRDTAPAAVTIKPHNRTLDHDRDRAGRGVLARDSTLDPRQCVLIRPRMPRSLG